MTHRQLTPQFALVVVMALIAMCCSTPDMTREGQQRVAPSDQMSTSARLDSGIVAIGDSISMSVWDAPQFNTHTAVRLSGTISIPLIGEIRVLGYSKEELIRILRRKLSEYIKGDALLSVEVTKPPPKISVFGQVARQGSYPVDNDLLLVDALILAGGWGETADLRYVRITHQSAFGVERGSVEFDLTPFLETGEIRRHAVRACGRYCDCSQEGELHFGI